MMFRRIRSLRKHRHVTQCEMAERLGISRRTYANYERGVHAMPVEVLIVIADIFGTSLDYLAGRITDRQEGFPLL
ncbi:MAG: helix-turn-helix domain-containing protein [Oscillospiraceae bacterium]|nr:helix-turn-helix domain-containing protein [Oscillospiraceae bacterium]